MLVYLVLIPSVCLLILNRNKSKLNLRTIKNKWGSVYINYETDKKSAYRFKMLFFYRRLLFAFVLAHCQVSVVLQLQLLIYCSLVLFIYMVKWCPMESKRYKFVAILTNACRWLVVTCLCCLRNMCRLQIFATTLVTTSCTFSTLILE